MLVCLLWLVLVLASALVVGVLAGVGALLRRRPDSRRPCQGIVAISVVGTALLVTSGAVVHVRLHDGPWHAYSCRLGMHDAMLYWYGVCAEADHIFLAERWRSVCSQSHGSSDHHRVQL